MRSRIAVSAALILIAAVVVRGHGSEILKEFRFLHGSCSVKTSEVRVLMNLNHACTRPAQAHPATAISTDAKVIPLHRSASRQLLCSRARSIQRVVANLIDSDH